MEATDGGNGALRALRDRYLAVLARIGAAARAAGRDPEEVALLAVSKTFPAEQVLALAALGQRAFGESYVQEALPKIARCAQLAPRALADSPLAARSPADPEPAPAPGPRGRARPELQWHFIGPIQSNKTRAIAEHFDWVHGVDRAKIARRLDQQRPASLGALCVCLQVNVSGEASKSGCRPEDVVTLAREVGDMPRLRLRGLMTIPEPTDDRALQQARFATVARLAQSLRAEGIVTDTLSMGMSDDLEAAVAAGSTMVRVGTAIFGARLPALDGERVAGARR